MTFLCSDWPNLPNLLTKLGQADFCHRQMLIFEGICDVPQWATKAHVGKYQVKDCGHQGFLFFCIDSFSAHAARTSSLGLRGFSMQWWGLLIHIKSLYENAAPGWIFLFQLELNVLQQFRNEFYICRKDVAGVCVCVRWEGGGVGGLHGCRMYGIKMKNEENGTHAVLGWLLARTLGGLTWSSLMLNSDGQVYNSALLTPLRQLARCCFESKTTVRAQCVSQRVMAQRQLWRMDPTPSMSRRCVQDRTIRTLSLKRWTVFALWSSVIFEIISKAKAFVSANSTKQVTDWLSMDPSFQPIWNTWSKCTVSMRPCKTRTSTLSLHSPWIEVMDRIC